MDYQKDLLGRLVDKYEQQKDPSRATARQVGKIYPEYNDHLSEAETNIDAAISDLVAREMIDANRTRQGYYEKVCLRLDSLPRIYSYLSRKPMAEIRKEQELLLQTIDAAAESVLYRFAMDALAILRTGKPMGFDIGKDTQKLQNVVCILEKLEQLKSETYVRNFSEAIFHDSKQLKPLLGTVKKILIQYTEEPLNEKNVLEHYNLFENPVYIYLKGGWILHYPDAQIDVSILPGGIALAPEAMAAVCSVSLTAQTVISVENLTTYHDMEEARAAVIYLGGFHNTPRTIFLRKLYDHEPDARYFHQGDLDPYGFLILENLKEKTGIPFEPMKMDMNTLRQCYERGHYRPLNANDLKTMQKPELAEYRDIFDFMKEHNCKVEQECFEAMKLNL